MAESELYLSLLRISAAQALRAAGLTTAKPSVLDAFTDITRRYLSLLALTTRDFAERSNRPEPVLSDVRAAMEHVGLIHPVEIFTPPPPNRLSHRYHLTKRRRLEISSVVGNALLSDATPTTATPGLPDALELINNPATSLSLNHSLMVIDPAEILLSNNRSGMDPGTWGNERQFREGEEEEEGQGGDGDYDEENSEDTRGVDALIAWFKGPVAAEMRRVAGVTTGFGVEGADSGNSISTMPAPVVMMAIANGSRTTPAVDVSSGIAPHAGEREANPITWLDGLKNKPERWKGTAIGPSADDTPIRIEGGPLSQDT